MTGGGELGHLAAAAGAEGLAIRGTLATRPEDGLPGIASLVLLGPADPGFWQHVAGAPEFADGQPDPLDRWSRRVIGRIACSLRAKAYFPFGGPPWRPFYRWALRSNRGFASPVGLLVHDEAGLLVSYRGAIGLRHPLPDVPAASPCDGCGRPCETACPVGALTTVGYDTALCRGYLRTPHGTECLARGCLVRRTCPASPRHGMVAARAAFHMAHFLESE